MGLFCKKEILSHYRVGWDAYFACNSIDVPISNNKLEKNKIEKYINECSYTNKHIKIKYYSSEPFKVVNVSDISLNLNYFRCNCDIQNSKKKIKKCDECGIDKNRNKQQRVIKFKKIIDEHDNVWFIVFRDYRSKLINILNTYKQYCIKKKGVYWVEYYFYKELFLPNWFYSYSSTVHKAQGSEWEKVFVSMDNIRNGGFERNNIPKLAYTAVSRMKKDLFFI